MKEIFTTGYPRSGNTWLNRLLSDILKSPLQVAEGDPQILYYGERGGEFVIRKTHSMNALPGPTVFIYRDPRDVAVSSCFYRSLPITDLPTVIRGMIYYDPPDGPGPYLHFMRRWYKRPYAIAQVSYKDLHRRPVEVLGEIVYLLTGKLFMDDYLMASYGRQKFENMLPVVGDHHSMRKGIVGDWRNYFTRETGKMITDGLGDLMLEQGYIDSLDWWEVLS